MNAHGFDSWIQMLCFLDLPLRLASFTPASIRARNSAGLHRLGLLWRGSVSDARHAHRERMASLAGSYERPGEF